MTPAPRCFRLFVRVYCCPELVIFLPRRSKSHNNEMFFSFPKRLGRPPLTSIRLTETGCKPRHSGGDQGSLVNTTAAFSPLLEAPCAPHVLVLSRRTATPSGGMDDQQVHSEPQRRDRRSAGKQRHPAAGRGTSGSRVRTVRQE